MSVGGSGPLLSGRSLTTESVLDNPFRPANVGTGTMVKRLSAPVALDSALRSVLCWSAPTFSTLPDGASFWDDLGPGNL
jgi:hypothetical protein